MKIVITEECDNAGDIADLLRQIAGQIDSGNTSGFYPNWSLTDGDEDAEEEN